MSNNSASNIRSTNPFRIGIQTGLAAAAANRGPALALWIFGVALVTAYYQVPLIHEALQTLRVWKEQWGLVFAAISTGIVGGLIPPLIGWLAKQPSVKLTAPYLISNLLFWAYKGIEVDLLYCGQAMLFGDSAHWSTVLPKVAVDQAIYAPAMGLTNTVLFYRWRKVNYSWSQFRERLDKRWFSRIILPTLVSNWFVWIPACALVYLLPLGLQLPIQNLILCFWVLILVFLTDAEKDEIQP